MKMCAIETNGFVRDRCVVGDGYEIEAGVLYKAYRNWSKEHGQWTIGNSRFSRALRRKGYRRYKHKTTRRTIWRGIALIGMQPTARRETEATDIAAFIRECCVEGDRNTVTAGRLYDRYCRWAEERNEKPIANQRFSQTLRPRGYDRDHEPITRRMLWIGLGLKEDCLAPSAATDRSDAT